jgi:uncharacterized membrane protein YphA (DoxX/SURF4 family)
VLTGIVLVVVAVGAIVAGLFLLIGVVTTVAEFFGVLLVSYDKLLSMALPDWTDKSPVYMITRTALWLGLAGVLVHLILK